MADLRPDFMGWILSPASPRRIELGDALRRIDFVKSRCPQIQHVAVLARNSWNSVAASLRRAAGHFDFFQYVDPPSRLICARGSLNVNQLVPALRVRRALEAHDFSRFGPAPFFVLDSYVAGQPGGTGRRLQAELVDRTEVPFLLAGGLTPDNLAAAWDACPLAFGVDVSSGLESAPGRKDMALLLRFFATARDLPLHTSARVPFESPTRPGMRYRSQRGFGAR